MKLQSLTIIFLIITIPIILLLAYYIQLQVDTISLQVSYNNKLIESTKEALNAFEINTVEWNSEYSEVAGSKRRDITASINTFLTSLSNNLGIGGTDKSLLLNYIPGIVYTLYDGYYIYGISDNNVYNILSQASQSMLAQANQAPQGVLSLIDNQASQSDIIQTDNASQLQSTEKTTSRMKIQHNTTKNTTKTHILQPFVAYSEEIQGEGNKSYIINYTLDNYMTVYTDGKEDEDFIKSGYLIFISKRPGIKEDSNGNVSLNITKENDETITIMPETLKENIEFKFYNFGDSRDEIKERRIWIYLYI